jgi:hypothetical protein
VHSISSSTPNLLHPISCHLLCTQCIQYRCCLPCILCIQHCVVSMHSMMHSTLLSSPMHSMHPAPLLSPMHSMHPTSRRLPCTRCICRRRHLTCTRCIQHHRRLLCTQCIQYRQHPMSTVISCALCTRPVHLSPLHPTLPTFPVHCALNAIRVWWAMGTDSECRVRSENELSRDFLI